ncbi:hypothetical protein XU18_4859 [Perkinsela sp. CCAP 1560/4]|nr:hypothetical protein XU18_4859 [Perkinsela sp. CCAP 1560/4]|eukprot:KNH03783.1 hypothetical protein XU18_4859 [Perkinsela sp. CCAP 1560/4]
MVETPETLEETYSLPECCHVCLTQGELKIQKLTIPHFPETLLFAYHCPNCGYKNNELVNGEGISTFGKRFTLHVETPDDLDRQVIMMRSGGTGGSGCNTAEIRIPDLGLHIGSGGESKPSLIEFRFLEDIDEEILDSIENNQKDDLSYTLPSYFTTVQGLLQRILANLWNMYKSSQQNRAESASKEETARLKQVLIRLKKMTRGDLLPFTVILEDTLAGISIDGRNGENLDDPFSAATEPFTKSLDEQLVVEAFQRTPQEDSELGVSEMCTEGYQSAEPEETKA